MKRIIALVTLIIVTVIALTGCSPLEVLSADEFTSRMEAQGYIVEDISEIASAVFDDAVGTVLIVQTETFGLEFLVFETEANARVAFNNVQRAFEDGRGLASSHSSSSAANFSRFRQTTEGRFEIVTRVENTLLISQTSSDNRNDVEAVFDLLGY